MIAFETVILFLLVQDLYTGGEAPEQQVFLNQGVHIFDILGINHGDSLATEKTALRGSTDPSFRATKSNDEFRYSTCTVSSSLWPALSSLPTSTSASQTCLEQKEHRDRALMQVSGWQSSWFGELHFLHCSRATRAY